MHPKDEQPVELDPAVDDQPETVDHPAVVTDDEAEAGHTLYLAVDDLDDESNGLDK